MRFRRPNHATVVAYLALFVALGGGTTAVALSGSNTVQSDDLGPGAQVKAPDVADNAVDSADVVNESLTGADIKNRSGVQTCVNSNRVGQLCMRAENLHRQWVAALLHCANLDMRLPTLSEALQLATTHNMPNVDEDEDFWTQDVFQNGDSLLAGYTDDKATFAGFLPAGNQLETVCVTEPSA